MPNTVTCEKCGVEYGIGASPWCRDNHATGGRHGYGAFTPGVDEMIGSEPVHFGNWGEKLRYMDRHGIEARDQGRFERKQYYDQKGR